MKYENINHKINKLWIQIHKADNTLDKQVIDINKVKSNFNQIVYNIKDIAIDYSSEDWLKVIGDANVGTHPRHFYEWNLVFDKMDIRLLPFFNINIVYYHPSDMSFRLQYRDRTKDIIFQIEETQYGEYIKKVTCICFFMLEQDYYNFEQKIDVKLLFTILNPRQYV